MKKLSLFLAIVMLLCSLVVFVSAEEKTVVDRSKFECEDDIIYLEYNIKVHTKVGEIIDKSGDSSAVVIDINGNILDTEANVPNGVYLATMCNGVAVDKVQICSMRDVNCDGNVTAADARLSLRCSANLETLTMIQQLAADVNKDGKVTAADARLILRFPAGLI